MNLNFWSFLAVIVCAYMAFAFIYNFVKMRHDEKMKMLHIEELKTKIECNNKKETNFPLTSTPKKTTTSKSKEDK